LPHFDEFGGDNWMCQAPGHRGDRVQNSRVEPHGGMAGETVLVCGIHGIVWEDAEGAIRNVF
jgi:hypothetical protein